MKYRLMEDTGFCGKQAAVGGRGPPGRRGKHQQERATWSRAGASGRFFQTDDICHLDAQRLDQCPRVQDEVLINSILINQLIKQDS